MFNEKGVKLTKSGTTIPENSGAYNVPVIEFKACKVDTKNKGLYKLWHERLGHIRKGKMLEIKRKNLFSDNSLLNSVNPTDNICEACLNGK